jgi:hypothetical protein
VPRIRQVHAIISANDVLGKSLVSKQGLQGLCLNSSIHTSSHASSSCSSEWDAGVRTRAETRRSIRL